jgi:hypothetical protein
VATDDDAGPTAEPDPIGTEWSDPIGTEWSDPTAPTPASGDEDVPVSGAHDLAPAVLGAMRNRMHSNHRMAPGEDGYIGDTLGGGDDAIEVIDDGPDHCMIGHAVGQAPDGCVYALVARVSLDQYGDVVAGDLDPTELFSDARAIALCGVVEEDHEVTNVFLVQHYRRARDVPADYLPGSPFLEFTDDPDAEA